MRRDIAWLGLWLWVFVGMMGCSPGSRSTGTVDSIGSSETLDLANPNIILISVDTLRADHLGFYGYERDTSPRLDRLASESLIFESAFAPAPWTLPSHAAMLTGVHPYALGIDTQYRTLPEGIPTLAERLGEQGYETAAFVDSGPQGFVGAERGFSRGFDLFRHAPHGDSNRQRFDIAATVTAAFQWLDGRSADQPFFLFLHTKSVHAMAGIDPCRDERCLPYDQPVPHRLRFVDPNAPRFLWRSEDGEVSAQSYLWSLNEKIVAAKLDPRAYSSERLEVLRGAFDSGIRWVDHELGRLYDGLMARGRLADTVLVVTADHGESFLENDLFMHQELYESTLRVPLVVRLPGGGKASGGTGIIEATVTLEDIAPTLLNLAGALVPPEVLGRQLPLVTTQDEKWKKERDLFSYYEFPGRFTYRAYSLRRGSSRLILDNLNRGGSGFRSRIFNLGGESGAGSQGLASDVEEAMTQALAAWMRSQPLARGPELGINESSGEDFLRSLGYVE